LKNSLRAILFFITTSLFALSNHSYQGGVAVVELKGFTQKPKLFYKAKEAKVIRKNNRYFAAIGIGLDEKVGKRHIVAVTKDKKEDFYFNVKKKAYKKEYIKLKTNKHVNLSKKNLKRYYQDRAKSKKVLNSFNKNLSCNLNFIAPLHGRLSSEFGKRRYFNGKPKSPHKGVDIAAKKGTPIIAAEDGIVAIKDNFFFNGNTIYLDHGEGVVSIYCHMSKFAVKKGDFVHKGEIIGYVGSTGRVTGSHLHFGIVLNKESVDPAIFIKDYAAASAF
jgi:murein DD-endopeptidase MepM/ murein hydrolase activator NlpD